MKARNVLAAFVISASMAVIGCGDAGTVKPKIDGGGDSRLQPAKPVGGGAAPAGQPAPKPQPE